MKMETITTATESVVSAPRSKQELADKLAELLFCSELACSVEMEIYYHVGACDHPDGGVTLSIMMDAFTGSIGLIADKNGEVWLTWWKPGEEAGRTRRIELHDDLDALASFCNGLLVDFYFRK